MKTTSIQITRPFIACGRSGGFTLLEVLVALLVLSVGLLGIAGLQLTSLRSNHSAYLRSQATILAYDILDRMRANRAQAQAGGYNATIDDAKDLPSTDDDSSQAAADLNSWGTDVLALPGAAASVSVDANNMVDVCISWDDSHADRVDDRTLAKENDCSGDSVTDPSIFKFQTEL